MPNQGTPRRIADRYILEDELGRGGIGIVWRARDELLRRQVAVKEISFPRAVSSADGASLKERVLREARAAAGINHAGVVGVYDILQEDGSAFIVMELIEAPTLQDLVKDEGPLQPARAATIGLDVLETLELAHARGIIHRDVKPANVMVPPDGPAKLADFGIASLQNDPRLTASGIILGSPAFMAPEQAHENVSSPATDIWGLGATLFFAVHGEPAFDKGQAIPTLTAVLSDEPDVQAKAGALGPVIKALLEKDPTQRPSAAAAREMLHRVVDGGSATPTSAATAVTPVPHPTAVETMPERPAVERPESEPVRERVSYTPDESRGKGLLIGLGVAAVIGLIAVLFLFGGDDEDPANPAADKKKSEANGNSGAGNEEEDVPPTDDESAEGEGEEVPVDDGGLSPYTDPASGYSVSVPDGWTPESAGDTATDFVGPTGAYLRVAYRTPPGEDVLGTLQGQYEEFGARYEDYEEISIESVEFRDYEAAQAEYTYQGQHAINLQFVTGDYGFALNFQTSEDEWEELLPTFEAIKASFEAP